MSCDHAVFDKFLEIKSDFKELKKLLVAYSSKKSRKPSTIKILSIGAD